LFSAIIVGLVGAMLWMYKKEKRQRKLKEHYEEQFAQTTAYRRTIASSAVSLMGSEMEETKTNSGRA
jgi:predicted histidine transporter YuiF (NhaC family)